MDDFEKRLSDLPLRRPSAELDDRILMAGAEARAEAEEAEARGESPRKSEAPIEPRARIRETGVPLVYRRVPVWAALAASVLLAALGFAGGAFLYGRSLASKTQTAEAPAIRMQVIYTNSPSNPFDYTRASQDFLPADLNVDVRKKGGV